jgi:hypothetical protein
MLKLHDDGSYGKPKFSNGLLRFSNIDGKEFALVGSHRQMVKQLTEQARMKIQPSPAALTFHIEVTWTQLLKIVALWPLILCKKDSVIW